MLIQEQQLKTFKAIFYSCSRLLIFTGRNEVVAKVMFLLVSVILLTRGVSASVHAGIPPPWSRHPLGADPTGEDTPQEQTPPQSRHPASVHAGIPPPPRSRHPPGADPPWSRYHPWEQTRPQEQTPPPPRADTGIRSMSGRYASYWNAFLL